MRPSQTAPSRPPSNGERDARDVGGAVAAEEGRDRRDLLDRAGAPGGNGALSGRLGRLGRAPHRDLTVGHDAARQHRVERDAVPGHLTREGLEGGEGGGALGVGEHEVRDRLAHRRRAHVQDAPPAPVAHPGEDRPHERHRREHERRCAASHSSRENASSSRPGGAPPVLHASTSTGPSRTSSAVDTRPGTASRSALSQTSPVAPIAFAAEAIRSF